MKSKPFTKKDFDEVSAFIKEYKKKKAAKKQAKLNKSVG